MNELSIKKENIVKKFFRKIKEIINPKSQKKHSNEKANIFELYHQIKQEPSIMKKLNKDELIKINLLLKQENLLLDKRIEEKEEQILKYNDS